MKKASITKKKEKLQKTIPFISPQEVKKIEKRLKKLGYLD